MRKKSNIGSYIFGTVFIVIIGALLYLFNSSSFEQNKPQVSIQKDIYWNLRDSLNFTITDDTGIKYYKITYMDGENEKVLDTKVLETPQTSIDLKIEPPKLGMFYKGENVKLKIEATDISKWNFFNGNSMETVVDIIVDSTRPVANVIANTYAIVRGGSGVVIVEVRDENLEDMYLTFNDIVRFELTPFYKEGYYISLLAWPMEIESFEQVSLIATDKANNTTKTKVPLYIRNYNYKTDDLEITDNFIENVSTIVLENARKPIDEEPIKRFLRSNMELRAENINTIKKVTLNSMDVRRIDKFEINPFVRLRNSKTLAGYGDKRNYFYKGQQIDTQWHLGIDWASVRNAPIHTSNSGRVIYKGYLGIYGNTLIVDHGLGLGSLYAHFSSATVDEGDMVQANAHIANTGATGAVFGDHLHFGVLVQGNEVNPLEWMDRSWIKTRITDIIDSAKKAIDTK
ncbi:M23 family metallopeptidase [Arcobacter sp. FWKO B]|uniref:M23 family metallopeptidase n=1 Tax=Arcobacter sp. FWKO B TaxID=2593672 RepID=UPI0018A438A7|nr:M23 family metallopeptidase [Arcobacter sp. FWKO B]QOG12626.1 M23 family metallopeptidase [Arcobacter sp. FWKO B]